MSFQKAEQKGASRCVPPTLEVARPGNREGAFVEHSWDCDTAAEVLCTTSTYDIIPVDTEQYCRALLLRLAPYSNLQICLYHTAVQAV